MTDELEPLSTDISDFLFLDVETRSTENVKVHGAYRHNANGFVTILAYAVGDGKVKDWCVGSWGERLHWKDAPDDLKAALRRVRAGEMWIVAWNAAFEYLALTRGIDGDLDDV